MWEVLQEMQPLRYLLALPWARLLEQPIGIQIALGGLLIAFLLGAAAALGRLAALLTEPEAAPKRRKQRFGLKHLALLLIALLPGGLVGTAAVVMAMGKKNWRSDAIRIVDTSMVPAIALAWISSPYFPLPQLADHLFVSGVLGLAFLILQWWATIKLLREAWGEPEKNIPWWPPLALWTQGALLFGSLCLILH